MKKIENLGLDFAQQIVAIRNLNMVDCQQVPYFITERIEPTTQGAENFLSNPGLFKKLYMIEYSKKVIFCYAYRRVHFIKSI